MVLQVVGVGTVAASRNAFNEIVVAVFLLYLVVAHKHFSIHTSRVGTWLTIGIIRYLVLLFFLTLQVSQKA